MKKLILVTFLFGCFNLCSQTKKILTIISFEEVEKLHQQNPKPIVVFIYTDWCKICYAMKQTTFKNQKIIDLLNRNFYFISLNGEEKKDITFLGKTFVYKPSGNKTGTHELAKELATLNGKIAYPTTTILNRTFLIDLQINGFINSKKMERILRKQN